MTYDFKINKKAVLALTAVFFLLVVATAEARTVVRTGDTISITEDQTIEGDFYTAAGKINVSGSVEADILAAGGQVVLNGEIGEDAFLVGGTVATHSVVGDDLRIIAGEVTVAADVKGDLFVMAGTVNILSTATITGDLIVYAGQVTVEGEVQGDVFGTVDTLRIDSKVGGDVDVAVGQLTLGDRTEVAGAVIYTSNNVAVQAQQASVEGDLLRNDPILPGSSATTVRSLLIPVLVLLFSVAAWFLVSRKSLAQVVERSLKKSPRPVLLGFAVLFFSPLAIGALLVSMIGTVVGLVALLGYLLFVILSVVGASAVLGQLLMRSFNRPSTHVSLLSLAIGVVAVSALMLLPVVGLAILLAFSMITLGAMVDLLVRPTLK